MIGAPGETTIGRMRVASRDGDSLALRCLWSRWLSAVDWRPPGLPVSGILCIRQLRGEPLPAACGAIGPDPEWEQAVRARLEHLARAAARPALGSVPAGAEAVVFADRAELL